MAPALIGRIEEFFSGGAPLMSNFVLAPLQSSSVLLAGSLSPSLIRDQVASGGFPVTGAGQLEGRQVLKLTWTSSPGRLTVTTILWVDGRTYLPVRSVATTRAPLQDAPLRTDTTQYQILPAIPLTCACSHRRSRTASHAPPGQPTF